MQCVVHHEVKISWSLGKSIFKNPQYNRHRYWKSAILFPFLLLADIEVIVVDTVLKRLKLEDLTEKFQTEHITPDIVCKMSVYEKEMLGINSRGDKFFLNSWGNLPRITGTRRSP